MRQRHHAGAAALSANDGTHRPTDLRRPGEIGYQPSLPADSDGAEATGGRETPACPRAFIRTSLPA